MAIKKIKQRKSKSFATVFCCITILIVGAIHLLLCGDMGYDSVLGLFVKVIPACLVMGILGYKIGDIVDHPHVNRADNYRNLIMDELQNISENMDLHGFSDDFPDFGEINAKLISEGQAEEPKMKLTEENGE